MSGPEVVRREFLGLMAGAAGAAIVPSVASGKEAPGKRQSLAFERHLPVGKPYNAVVCGGGPSGVAAALAARRGGLSVLAVEGQGQLGGTCTSGLVSHWLGGRASDCKRWVVGGLFRSMSEEAAKRGFALLPEQEPDRKLSPHGWGRGQLTAGVPFDPFGMAAYLDERMAEAGVDVLLGTQVVDVRVEGERITHVVIHNKSGLAAVPVGVVVDATGDADVAARSGCDVAKGRTEDGLMTPTSLIFHVDNVDQDTLSTYIAKHHAKRFREKIKALRASGEWTFPYEIFISVQLQEKGTMMINTTRLVGIDGTNGASRSDGLVRGRQEIQQLMVLMRKHFPGFADARLKAVAPQLGVRETRRIRGPYVLTVEDLTAGKAFDDCIGLSAYGWDLPNPKRPSDNPSHGRMKSATPIPYRIMVPKPVRNLICPGRAVSVERAVLGPLRVMAPCMAMGEAAGTAAVQVVGRKSAFGDVDTRALRNTLREHGAILSL